ncbi:MAG: hypothetical protein V2B20_23080 [Pseudomonadota bacterium]
MPTIEIISYVSFVVGVFGILIAFYQGFERKRLKQFLYSQAWHIFSVSNISFGTIQAALKSYKTAHNDKTNTDVIELLSKCEAHNVNLFIEAIRQIQLSEPRFDLEMITSWTMQGKITKEQAPYFLRMMPFSKPRLIRLFFESINMRWKQKLMKRITQPHQDINNPESNNKVVQKIT